MSQHDVTRLRHRMRFGTEIQGSETLFRLWAPKQKAVKLRIKGRRAKSMEREPDGWHVLRVETAPPGTLYQFELMDGTRIADPASRFQPEGLESHSEVIDPGAYLWRTADWPGRAWTEAIIYELHIGTFTQEGTWAAAARRLDHLKALGITAIEIMPVAQCYGDFNWGYDGGLWFAPANAYGRPEEFKAYVDAAHERGMMVFLDVVHNHFGPVGNMLPKLGPIFTSRHESPWGEAINLDDNGSAMVRQLIVENALYWMTEYNLDGLRFDALHVLKDDSNTHLFDLLTARLRAKLPHRQVHLIAENSDNQARWLDRDDQLRPIHFTAQWNDDLHHLLHAAITGEDTGYFADYANGSAKGLLGRALAEGFAYQGERKPHEDRISGQPSAGLPPSAFVTYLQNHDQIGNRVTGARITALAPPEAIEAALAIVLLSPQIPLMFMGDEFAARTPFQFFSDLPKDLHGKIYRGRKAELQSTPEPDDPAAPDAEETPKPTDRETFLRSRLNWLDRDRSDGQARLRLMRALIDFRQREIVPGLEIGRAHV